MVSKKFWSGIIILLFILILGGLTIWYYMNFSVNKTPTRGVYVKNVIENKYG
ncbi:hypothetical protein [Defluviitalea phaphyphila]|uniref:hypothetical protein n=1 Tax=Defluviitalea phaphyphila TaxID=1473580 RepID=UPI00136539FF|nr:hypothetical protein [Defluviitalea phaphyphila]